MEPEEQQVRDGLIAAIRSAFDVVDRIGRITLHEAVAIDAYATPKDQARAREQDTEQHWQEIPEKDMEAYTYVLTYANPIGFRYYIPAYMTFALNCFRQSPRFDWDSVIYALNLNKSAERFSLLDNAQRETIYRFLNYFARFDPEGDYCHLEEVLHTLESGWKN